MLGVEQQPVEAAVADDVRRNVAAQAAPQADLQLAGGDGVLEGIAGEVHRVVLRKPRDPGAACARFIGSRRSPSPGGKGREARAARRRYAPPPPSAQSDELDIRR